MMFELLVIHLQVGLEDGLQEGVFLWQRVRQIQHVNATT